MRALTGALLRLALPALLALALSGCSGEPVEGARVPSRTATASSSSPTPATPEEQVEAAVRAYYAELTRAAQTQDTSDFKLLVTKGCPCFGVVGAIRETRREGKSTPDAAWDVVSVNVHELEGDTAVAEVKYKVAPYKVLNRHGKVVDRYADQDGHVDLSLALSDRGWIVVNLFDLEG